MMFPPQTGSHPNSVNMLLSKRDFHMWLRWSDLREGLCRWAQSDQMSPYKLRNFSAWSPRDAAIPEKGREVVGLRETGSAIARGTTGTAGRVQPLPVREHPGIGASPKKFQNGFLHRDPVGRVVPQTPAWVIFHGLHRCIGRKFHGKWSNQGLESVLIWGC